MAALFANGAEAARYKQTGRAHGACLHCPIDRGTDGAAIAAGIGLLVITGVVVYSAVFNNSSNIQSTIDWHTDNPGRVRLAEF